MFYGFKLLALASKFPALYRRTIANDSTTPRWLAASIPIDLAKRLLGVALVPIGAMLAPGCGGNSSDYSLFAPGDSIPGWERIDARSKQYFRAKLNDSWTYSFDEDTAKSLGPTSKRTVVASENDRFTIATLEGGVVRTEQFRRSEQGIALVNPFGKEAPQSLQDALRELLIYPEPFFLADSSRGAIREGTWGEDLDGDGVKERFKLILRQTFRGFKSADLPHERIADAAQFSTVLELSVPLTTDPTRGLHSWQIDVELFAPYVGLVWSETGVFSEGKRIRHAFRTLTEATLDGMPLQARPVDGDVRTLELVHNDLVYDGTRNLYYASVPALEPEMDNRVVAVDASTGKIAGSFSLGGDEPFSLALSSDAAGLYVGISGSGQVIKLSTVDFSELYRTQLPLLATDAQTTPYRIAASPKSQDVIAVSIKYLRDGRTSGRVVLVRDGIVEPLQHTTGPLAKAISFSRSGASVFAFDIGSRDNTLRRLNVTSVGLAQIKAITVHELFTDSMSLAGDKLLVGNRLFQPDTLRELKVVAVSEPYNYFSDHYCTLASSATKIACVRSGLRSIALPEMRIRVVDPSTGEDVSNPVYNRSYDRGEPIEIITGGSCSIALRSVETDEDDSSEDRKLRSADRLILMRSDHLC